MDSSLTEAYGAYPVPDDIHRLHRLEETLGCDGLSLSLIGLRPACSYYSCPVAPPDWIPFAETGGDGIQFGVLTEFGRVRSLDDAPVVCVSPGNDPPVRLMARCLREFWNLAASVPHAELLDGLWPRENVAEFREEAAVWEAGELGALRKEVLGRFRSHFGTRQVQVLEHLQGVRMERNGLTAVPTFDGLGVLRQSANGGQYRRYPIDVFQPLGGQERAQMDVFWAEANKEEKLALIKDIAYRYLDDMWLDDGLLEWFKALLQSVGLKDEAGRLF